MPTLTESLTCCVTPSKSLPSLGLTLSVERGGTVYLYRSFWCQHSGTNAVENSRPRYNH